MLLLLLCTFALAHACDQVLQTHTGPVCGVKLPSGAANFLGIPYAAAPVGPLRFASPVEPQPWTEPRDGSACVHNNSSSAQRSCVTPAQLRPRLPAEPPQPRCSQSAVRRLPESERVHPSLVVHRSFSRHDLFSRRQLRGGRQLALLLQRDKPRDHAMRCRRYGQLQTGSFWLSVPASVPPCPGCVPAALRQ